jgi:tetratricopeptide (TPR) repeat protein
MKNILCIIFVCLLCFTNNFAQQNKVTDQIEEALKLLQNNQLDEAEKLLQKLRITAPNNVDIHNLLGIVLDQKGNPAEAEKQFRQALKSSPKAVSPLANLGVLLAKSARKKEAIQIFETVIRLAPNHPEATINLGFLYNSVGNNIKAVEYLKKANSIQPNTYDIIFNLGTALYNTRSIEDAEQTFETAVSLSPQSAEPVYWLGMIASGRNQDDLAGNYFEKAVSLRPNYTEAIFMLGELFTKYKRYADAKTYYELVLKNDSTKPVYYVRLGGIYLFLKDFENALKIFKKGTESFPKIPELHYFLAIAARGLGNFDLALAETKKSLAIKETADSYSLFGVIMADRNEIVEAEKSLRKALLLNPKHFNSLNDLGRLLVKNRRFEEAIPILQRAAALSTNPDVHYQLFLAYTRLKRKTEAMSELEVFKQLSEKK